MDPAIQAILIASIGACGGIFTTLYVQHRNDRSREKSAENDRIIAERRFQRSNLIDLQPQIQSLTGLAYRDYSAGWADIGDAIDTEMFNATVVQVSLLAERIADDILREKVIQLKCAICALVSVNSEEEARSYEEIVMKAAPEVKDLIGREIRRLGEVGVL